MVNKKYQKGDENSYFPAVIAGLLVIAVALATFVVNLVRVADRSLDEVIIGEESGEVTVDPGNGPFPETAPEDVMTEPVNPPL